MKQNQRYLELGILLLIVYSIVTHVGFLVDLRSLRLVRVTRVLRLFKLNRYTNALQSIRSAFVRVRYEFGVLSFAVLTLVWLSSIAVYEFEKEAQPQSFGKLSDAFWYTLTTITTVGYGDKVPVTAGGRLVGVALMIGGLGLFGTFVSLVGSSFLEEIRKSTLQEGSAPSISEVFTSGELAGVDQEG